MQTNEVCGKLPFINSTGNMMFRLDGKVALVSGAGRGMGFGVAQCLARQGALVVVNDFFADRAEAAAQALLGEGLAADFAVANMTDRPAIFLYE